MRSFGRSWPGATPSGAWWGGQRRVPQLDRARAGLPVALAIAVTLRKPLGVLLAVSGAGQAADLQLHQAFGRKADHLAQQVGVGGPSPAGSSGSSSDRSSVGLPVRVGSNNPTLTGNRRWLIPPRRRPPATALFDQSAGGRLRYPPSYTTPWDTTTTESRTKRHIEYLRSPMNQTASSRVKDAEPKGLSSIEPDKVGNQVSGAGKVLSSFIVSRSFTRNCLSLAKKFSIRWRALYRCRS